MNGLKLVNIQVYVSHVIEKIEKVDLKALPQVTDQVDNPLCVGI